MTVVYFGIAWLSGIWLASWLNWPAHTWLLSGLVSSGWGLFLRRRQRLKWALALFYLAAIGLAGLRYATAVPVIDANHIASYNDGPPLTFTGLVVGEPDIRDLAVNLRVAVESITSTDGATQPAHGLVLVRAPRFPPIPYGSVVQVNGRVETPPEFDTFSYKEYLAQRGIHSLVNRPRITVLAQEQGSPLYHAIYSFKARAQAIINHLVPEPASALLSGILLGNDNGLPPDLAEDFRTTGMTHIIAISGFNIAILMGVLISLSQPLLQRRGAAVFATAGIAAYTLLVGADPSVVRAAIMGGIYLLANRWLGRANFAYASLFVAAFLMTLINPFSLWDVGFQLSFGATLGLMLYAEPFTRWTRRQLLRWLPRKTVRGVMGLLSDAVLVTLAAQVLTLPLMMAYFRQLSLVSFVANALILPAQPGVMIWGGLATLSGMASTAVGQLFGWVAWLFLTYTIVLVRALASLPGAAVAVDVGPGAIIAIYALIAAITWLARQSPEERGTWRAVKWVRRVPRALAYGGGVVATLLVVGWGMTQPDGRLHVTFFDVGQGDAIFIQSPGGRQILVDGGQYPSILNDQLGRQMPFWDREIDVVIATHPDADHVNGLEGVFGRYRVGLLVTDGSELGESPIYDAVLMAAQAQGTPTHRALAGEVVDLGDGARLELLHPDAVPMADRNENSVSLRLVYGDFSLLLTGDVEENGEKLMLANGRVPRSLVFKAGHHGSRTSSTLSLLQAVQPQIIVVSAGADNHFGHPHVEVLERAQAVGAIVLRTDELGPIQVTTDGRTMWWQAGPKWGP